MTASRRPWRLIAWTLESFLLRPRPAPRPSKNGQPSQPRRILILGYAAIGDALFLLPVLEALRKAYPSARLTFLANRNPITQELIPATGLADEIRLVEWEGEKPHDRRAINEELARADFDMVILSLSAPAHFFARAIASIPCRVGHCCHLSAPAGLGTLAAWAWKIRRALVTGEFSRRMLLSDKVWTSAAPEHAVSRNAHLISALGLRRPAAAPAVPLVPDALDFAARELGQGARKRVGVHLGAPGNPYFKIWPAERFARLCRDLTETCGVECVLLGGPEERPSADLVLKSAPGARDFVGRCTLAQTFALISKLDLMISCDTGLAKAAMALGVPTATLWGPTDPRELGALWDFDKHLDLRLGIDCSPCVRLGMPFARAGIDYTDCGHHDCLRRMEEDWVLDSLRRKYPAILGLP